MWWRICFMAYMSPLTLQNLIPLPGLYLNIPPEHFRCWAGKQTTQDDVNKPTTQLICDGKSVLAIYEGCNGINVMIIFVAFLVAFGPLNKALLWFVPVGLIILHDSEPASYWTSILRVALYAPVHVLHT